MRKLLRGPSALALLVFLTPAPATAQKQNPDTDQVNNGLVESLVPAGAQEQSTDDPSFRKSIGLTKIIVGGVGALFGGGMMAHSEAFGYTDGLNGAGLVIGAAIAGGGVLLIRDGVEDRRSVPPPNSAVSLAVVRGGAAVGFRKSW